MSGADEAATAISEAPDLAWLAPGSVSEPRAALQRIEAVCGMHPTLFGAVFALLATHPGVPRPVLAQAVKQFRRDADAHSIEDMLGLMTAVSNGAQQAFEAVLRTRRGSDRKAAALPFVRPD
ncbi:hypothetical protein ACPOLB_22840 [Rubrivivax sp. RP6-9]|uniref:hypothetical protein n=1 Tax=Rubrivivax sp. RP6-9 TaxID=3415750 RepID=UPI003CC6BFCF